MNKGSLKIKIPVHISKGYAKMKKKNLFEGEPKEKKKKKIKKGEKFE